MMAAANEHFGLREKLVASDGGLKSMALKRKKAFKTNRFAITFKSLKLVGEIGFEPTTLWSQTRCATRLRYSPTRKAR